MNWQRIMDVAGEVALGTSSVIHIRRWMQLHPDAAIGEIVQFTRDSSITDLDAMDSALLTFTNLQIVPDTRRNLIMYYATFKVFQTARYGQFTGFP